MNGPDHYTAAQTYTDRLDQLIDTNSDSGDCIALGIAALAHGVLALTAATLDAGADYPPARDRDWANAQGRDIR